MIGTQLNPPRGTRSPVGGRTLDQLRALRADPSYRLGGAQKTLAFWAVGNAWFAIFLTVPPNFIVGVYGWFIDFVLLLSCLLQFLVGSLLLKLPLRLPVAGVLITLFAVWGFVTTLLANAELGRELYSPIQYYTTWAFFFVMLYVSVDQGVYVSERTRRWIVIPWLGVLVFSAILALLQLAGFQFARDIGRDTLPTNMYRPNGLTDYTFALGAQSLIGAMLVGSWLLKRNLRWWEWSLVALFLVTILAAQYRSLYYTGIAVAAVAFFILQLRLSRPKAFTALIVFAASMVLPLVLFKDKFAYGLRGAENDPALMARYQSWRQLGPVLQERPFTGIGADQNLMIANNKANIDHWAGTVIDNFYRMVLICYGYIGFLLMLMAVTALVVGLFVKFDSARAAPVKVYTLTSLVLMVSLLGVSMTGNSFVYPSIGYSLALVLALGSATWREERETKLVSP
ncbi:MAG: hypothetical protein C4320_03990, partial [Armatimonadota bacterium]